MHTGGFDQSCVSPARAIEAIRRLTGTLETEAVIWGWSGDRALNEAICEALSAARVKRYFWLPIFSEVANAAGCDPFHSIRGAQKSGIGIVEGENFEFVCPASARNLQNAISTYEAVASTLDLTGVFLDRIRYPSAANSADSLTGCWCEGCMALYDKCGIQTDELKNKCLTRGYNLFEPCSIERGIASFEDADANGLFMAKRSIITDAVSILCSCFHKLGLEVGIDTFAPAVADYVGQDVFKLGELVDFIKPMMYRKTSAPAGVGFEADAIQAACGEAALRRIREHYNGDLLGREANLRQMRLLQEHTANVSPGIEINRVDNICATTPEYVCESIRDAQRAGCESVVLSWNILLIEDDMLQALKGIGKGR